MCSLGEPTFTWRLAGRPPVTQTPPCPRPQSLSATISDRFVCSVFIPTHITSFPKAGASFPLYAMFRAGSSPAGRLSPRRLGGSTLPGLPTQNPQFLSVFRSLLFNPDILPSALWAKILHIFFPLMIPFP